MWLLCLLSHSISGISCNRLGQHSCLRCKVRGKSQKTASGVNYLCLSTPLITLVITCITLVTLLLLANTTKCETEWENTQTSLTWQSWTSILPRFPLGDFKRKSRKHENESKKMKGRQCFSQISWTAKSCCQRSFPLCCLLHCLLRNAHNKSCTVNKKMHNHRFSRR